MKRTNIMLTDDQHKKIEEGSLSIGKLSEILGIDIVSLRLYLKEEGIQPQTQDKEEIAMDAENA